MLAENVETDQGRGGAAQEAYCFLLYTVAFTPQGSLQSGKQDSKLAVQGKWGYLWVGVGGTQLRPGLSPTYAQPPLCIVLHTHANIVLVDTKPSLYQGPFVF